MRQLWEPEIAIVVSDFKRPRLRWDRGGRFYVPRNRVTRIEAWYQVNKQSKKLYKRSIDSLDVEVEVAIRR